MLIFSKTSNVDKIRENFELLHNLVNNGGVILIAGKAQDMPDQVKEALVGYL